MKIVVKHKTVQGRSDGRTNPGTIPERGKLVMLGMRKRENIPSPMFFVPVVSMGHDVKTEVGYFKFATENDLRNSRAYQFEDGDIWWELPRNPFWEPEDRIAPDANVRDMLDKAAEEAAAKNVEDENDPGADAGASDTGTEDAKAD